VSGFSWAVVVALLPQLRVMGRRLFFRRSLGQGIRIKQAKWELGVLFNEMDSYVSKKRLGFLGLFRSQGLFRLHRQHIELLDPHTPGLGLGESNGMGMAASE